MILERSVVEQFENAFLDQGAVPIAPTLRVAFPAFGNRRKASVSGQLRHYAQLYAMQLVIERAR
jgi:hypothetical protein